MRAFLIGKRAFFLEDFGKKVHALISLALQKTEAIKPFFSRLIDQPSSINETLVPTISKLIHPFERTAAANLSRVVVAVIIALNDATKPLIVVHLSHLFVSVRLINRTLSALKVVCSTFRCLKLPTLF